MGRKSKDKEKRRQARKEKRERRSAGPPRAHLPEPSFDPPPERLGPPIAFAQDGRVVPDPSEVLGLPPGETDPERVRAAWRQQLERHPPEQEPERAREIREARDRLTDPAQVLQRAFGVIHLPDEAQWGLPAAGEAAQGDVIDAEGRLATQAVLYALVEDELLRQGLGDWVRPRR